MTEKSDNWRVPFEHSQLTTILHSTAMTRMAVNGGSYEEALTFAAGAVRRASSAAAALLERPGFSDAEQMLSRNALDPIIFGEEKTALSTLGFDSKKDL